MKTKLIIIAFVLLSISIYAQKSEIYLNDDLKPISQRQFNNPNKPHTFYNLSIELDTAIANVQVQRIKKGKISIVMLDSLKSELAKLSGKPIPKANTLVINYHHGLDRCISTVNKSYVTVKYKRFLKKINSIASTSHFFMYKSDEGIKTYGKKLKWIKDKFRTIEKTFLPLHYPCGSFVLIDENGNYYVNKGEYNIDQIIDLLKNKETTFTNTL